jgi:5-methylcytosine-specific restriction endonuclease McrA
VTGARAAAKAAGELRYFTGKPCTHGHIAERHVSSGKCMECAREDMRGRYHADPAAHNVKSRKWRQGNPEAYLTGLAVHREREREKRAAVKAVKDAAYAEQKALDPRLLTRAEARAQGKKHYFTGRPCPNGHVAYRQTRGGNCMECSREGARAIYHADPASAQQRSQKWKAANNHKVRVQARGWYARNSEKARGWEAQRYVLNRDRIMKQSKQYYNRVKHSESFKVQQKVLRARRRALMRKAAGYHSADDIRQIYNAQKGRCAYCRCRLGDAYHVDHIISLARGGTNWPSNIQLTCKPCNLRKNAKHPLAFARELGRLL